MDQQNQVLSMAIDTHYPQIRPMEIYQGIQQVGDCTITIQIDNCPIALKATQMGPMPVHIIAFYVGPMP